MSSDAGTPFDFNAIYTLLSGHPFLAILGVILFLIWKYTADVGAFFKEYFNKKADAVVKSTEELSKKSDKNDERYFQLYTENKEAVIKIADAVNSFEKAFISSETRTSERISGVETRLGEKIVGVENRLSEKIVSSAKDVVHHGKLDTLTNLVREKIDSTSSGGEESEDGTPK